jgi:membrane protease subunit (stomatin/prohibitin family)
VNATVKAMTDQAMAGAAMNQAGADATAEMIGAGGALAQQMAAMTQQHAANAAAARQLKAFVNSIPKINRR